MMKVVINLFAFLSIPAILVAQSNDPIVLQIGEKKINKSEFEYIYNKNNFVNEQSKEPITDYLERFINFKLKVIEAESLKLDTSSRFKNELEQYRGQLAKNYMVDSATINQLVREAYERMQFEVKASHILVKLDAAALPEDTLKAWNKIMALRKKVMETGDFEGVASSPGGSEDESAVNNKGSLGYFTAFRMVYPFESTAYKTPIGEVSMPFKTRFGYHIVKVYDKRPARGKIQVAHIMLSTQQASDNLEEIKKKIDEIHTLAKNGEDFGKLARQYSEDPSSSRNNGVMNWFGVGEYADDFLDNCFALTENGQISQPFKTRFGWHIVKRIDHKPIQSFEKEKPSIESRIQRDNRSVLVRSSFVDGLKKEYNYKEYQKNIEEIYKMVDTSIFSANWTFKKKVYMAKPIFSFADTTYVQQQFLDYLLKFQTKRARADLRKFLHMQFEMYVSNEISNYEKERLEEKYDKFRLTMQEYRDGLLLFDLMDKEVWSKASKDTIGLKMFFEQNNKRFMWPDRAEAVIYTCSDAKVANSAYKLVKKGKLSNEEIKKQLNKSSQLNIQIEDKIFVKDETHVLKKLNWNKGLNKPVAFDGGFVFVNLKKDMPSSPKSLDEARGPAIAAYQEYLEKTWVADLRDRYKIVVNQEVIKTIE
ncbi:MAG: peptidylprolyl isomerase [Flavobacteriales bacterium]